MKKTASNPIKAVIGKKAKVTAEPVVVAKPTAKVETKKPATPPVVSKSDVKPTLKAAKPPKPVIKAAVAPTPPPAPKRGTIEASLSKLRGVAEKAITGTSVKEEPEKSTEEVVKEMDTMHPEAMVRKPAPVVKKVLPPSDKISFDALMNANRDAQSQSTPLFDVTKYLKR